MRLCDLNDLQLQATADALRQISSRMVAAEALEELIDRRAAMSPMRALEMTLAYERAAGVIESTSVMVHEDGDLKFYDTFRANPGCDDDVQGEVEYLASRNLVIRAEGHRHWVAICDEGEPIGEMA